MRKIIFPGLFFCSTLCIGQPAEIIKLADLQRLLGEKSDKIHVVNFWATWCAPCVQELALFEKINAERRLDVKVTLVSLDLDLDPDPGKVYKFISRKNLQSEVVLLDETDPDSWINKIDKRWSGALPATIFINQKTGKRIFVGKALQPGELEEHLEIIKSEK
jgi:thiol-disulfide isomerase/thioredoxin